MEWRPAFLEFAERHIGPEARSAIVKGFKWVFGANQLGKPMFEPNLSLSIRSQVRKGELENDKWRAFRALRNSVLGGGGALIDSNRVTLRLECRSYELGWILWAFGKRDEFPELTHHPIFTDSVASSDGRRVAVASSS